MHKLYVVHSSHPSEAVKKALELKAIPYKTVEMLIPTQGPLTRLRFPSRTVPALRLDGGEKVQGSRAIMRRLDELAPEPLLVPEDPAVHDAVLAADEWGGEVLQPLARRAVWVALRHRATAIPSYQEASKLPRLPRPIVRLVAPAVIRVESALAHASDDAFRADLAALPGHLDRIDSWIREGVLGGPVANAADLQICSSLRLMLTIGDLRPLFAGRPCEALALRHFEDFPGDVPAGALPAAWFAAG